jgi:hypothetical protein
MFFFFWKPKKKITKCVEVEDISEGQDFAVLHINLIYFRGSENNIRKHWKVEDISDRNQTYEWNTSRSEDIWKYCGPVKPENRYIE